jgi:hypothetical protein
MANYSGQVDTKRVEAAHAGHAARAQAERDAKAAVVTAEADAKAAHNAAQKAADAGASLDKLMPLEEAVETANRRLAVARRMAEGAARRRQEGEATRDKEVRQAHGKAFTAGMQRFLAIRQEALAAFATLESLKAEHIAVRSELLHMGNVAKAGVPNVVEACQVLIAPDGKLMDAAEFANRLAQPQHNEWDAVAGKLRWVEA